MGRRARVIDNLDLELAELPPELRMLEWMGRVEAVIFASPWKLRGGFFCSGPFQQGEIHAILVTPQGLHCGVVNDSDVTAEGLHEIE